MTRWKRGNGIRNKMGYCTLWRFGGSCETGKARPFVTVHGGASYVEASEGNQKKGAPREAGHLLKQVVGKMKLGPYAQRDGGPPGRKASG